MVNIELGSGNDQFTVESTHLGLTKISAANGNDTIVVKTVAGHTIITTGAGTDFIGLASDDLIVDQITGVLTIDGGLDRDIVTVLDTADANDNVVTVTGTHDHRPRYVHRAGSAALLGAGEERRVCAARAGLRHRERAGDFAECRALAGYAEVTLDYA